MNKDLTNNKTQSNFKKYTGFTLVELMVAMFIGLIVLLGLVSLFSNVTTLNSAQSGLALLQENGRFAISRLKQDIEIAGQKHCASVALPNAFITDWDQGYEMKPWYIDTAANLPGSLSTNGLPTLGQISLDTITADPDQLGDSPMPPGLTTYPLDSSFFIRGQECTGPSCLPGLNQVGSDLSTNFRMPGITDDSRLPNTDILTVRYLTGGTQVSNIAGAVATVIGNIPASSSGNALIADCNQSIVTPVTWGGTNVTANNPLPEFSLTSKTSVYSMDQDFRTVSYFVGVDEDANDSTRVIPSLYRSENGVAQQLVEGVERFDVFYLAQLQTGRVARLTADQVQLVQGGGDVNQDNAIDGDLGCTLPSTISQIPNFHLPNDQGCLWRSIYAIEVYMLLNTVNDSSVEDDDRYVYSVDPTNPQNPSGGMVTGLPGERMYRKEFSAIVPIRNYTL